MSTENQIPLAPEPWVQWAEIPVLDFDRAKRFYETIFQFEIQKMDFGGFVMGFFPAAIAGVAICQGEAYRPSIDGALIYLNANHRMLEIQDRIEAAGGKILLPKRMISPDHGYMALFIDSEGNRLALYSTQ